MDTFIVVTLLIVAGLQAATLVLLIDIWKGTTGDEEQATSLNPEVGDEESQ